MHRVEKCSTMGSGRRVKHSGSHGAEAVTKMAAGIASTVGRPRGGPPNSAASSRSSSHSGPSGHVILAASARCKYSWAVPRPIEQHRAICRSPRPTSNFNRRTSLILHGQSPGWQADPPFRGEAACHCVVQLYYVPVALLRRIERGGNCALFTGFHSFSPALPTRVQALRVASAHRLRRRQPISYRGLNAKPPGISPVSCQPACRRSLR